jgi:hypothetical protein
MPGIGFARLLEAMALHVEKPAMIAATDALFLNLAVEQRRAAVHAARIDETGPPLIAMLARRFG